MAEQVIPKGSIHEVRSIPLRDGRRLAYTELGAAGGMPVLYCHGNPGSRLDTGLFDEQAVRQVGLRIIAPDRPGIGQSDFLPGRRIVDWPADVTQLVDALGLPQFAAMGLSGGGPFAAVTASALPERVTKLVLVSSLGRFDIPGATQDMGRGLLYFRLGRYFPWLLQLQLRLMAYGLKSDPSKMAEQVKMGLPPADIAAMSQPGVQEAFFTTMAAFLSQGARGPAHEAGLFMRPWGFSLAAVRAPAYLWHGEADRNAPVAMGRDLAGRIPGCAATFVPGEGHFSLLVNHFQAILADLAR